MHRNLFFVHLYNDYSGSPRVFSDAIDAVGDFDNISEKFLFTSHDQGFLSDIDIKKSHIFYKRSHRKLLQLVYFFISQVHLFFILSLKLLSHKIKNKDKQNIVIINTMLPFGAGLASKFFADKTIYYVHESHLKPRILKDFLRGIIEISSDYVLFVSQYLLECESFRKPTMSVIYNGLRNDFPSLPNVDSCNKFDLRTVVFSGSLKKYKGVDYIIDLAKLLPDFHFTLALNSTVSEIDNYFDTKDITKNVELLSRPNNLQDLYRDGFAILNFSIPELWTETFGLSILEGMNYGCVPIVPQVGGPIEIVDDNCGLLCNSRNTIEVKDFLTSLSLDYELWKKYSDAARLRSSHFSQDNYKTSLKGFFESL